MPVERTLERVDADVAAGRRALARQRLRGLVDAFPERLDLRERLAALYRLDGDAAQAGRWSYLSADADPREVAAFERAYRGDPIALMKALAWRRPEHDAATAVARERLRALRERAEADAGAPVDWADPRRPHPPARWWEPVAAGVAGVVVLALVVLFVVGVTSLVVRGWYVVLGWFG